MKEKGMKFEKKSAIIGGCRVSEWVIQSVSQSIWERQKESESQGRNESRHGLVKLGRARDFLYKNVDGLAGWLAAVYTVMNGASSGQRPVSQLT